MSKIVINVSSLTIADKLVNGQDIITKSTTNPGVPGSTAVLAAFSAAQGVFTATNAAYEAVNRLGQGPWSEPALRPVM